MIFSLQQQIHLHLYHLLQKRSLVPHHGADYKAIIRFTADDEAANFQALYTGIQGFQNTISLPVAVSSDNVSDLMHLLTNECPELMQLSSRWVEHSNLLGLVVSISPEYTISKETFDAQTAAVNTLIQSWQTTLSGQSALSDELNIFSNEYHY